MTTKNRLAFNSRLVSTVVILTFETTAFFTCRLSSANSFVLEVKFNEKFIFVALGACFWFPYMYLASTLMRDSKRRYCKKPAHSEHL